MGQSGSSGPTDMGRAGFLPTSCRTSPSPSIWSYEDEEDRCILLTVHPIGPDAVEVNRGVTKSLCKFAT